MLVIVVRNILQEAASRRWFAAVMVALTLITLVLGLALRTDAADGVLAGISLFGNVVQSDVMVADAAAQMLLRFASYGIFYGFMLLALWGTSDFAPILLADGRIGSWLALPIKRWQLLLAVYLAVCAIASLFFLYGALGVCVLTGIKTGVWTAKPLLAGLLGCASFCAVYGVMLDVVLVARSAALSGVAGMVTLGLGVLGGARQEVGWLMGSGLAQRALLQAAQIAPPISSLGAVAASLGSGTGVAGHDVALLVCRFVLFTSSTLVFGCWLFSRHDY